MGNALNAAARVPIEPVAVHLAREIERRKHAEAWRVLATEAAYALDQDRETVFWVAEADFGHLEENGNAPAPESQGSRAPSPPVLSFADCPMVPPTFAEQSAKPSAKPPRGSAKADEGWAVVDFIEKEMCVICDCGVDASDCKSDFECDKCVYRPPVHASCFAAFQNKFKRDCLVCK